MWVMAAVSTLAAAILTGVLLVRSHEESIEQQLQATATSLVTLGITQFSELRDFEDLNRFVEDALQMDRVDKVIRVYDGQRRLIFTTAGADYDKLPDTLAKAVTKPLFLTVEGRHRRYESLVMPYESEGSSKKFYLQVAIPLPKYSEMLNYLWWQSILLVGVLVGISILLSQWLSKRLLKPVDEIASHLQGMNPARIEEWKPLELDEKSWYLKSIAEAINLLADRTRAAIMQLRKMSRYVAHEMRTPLTILQGEAETLLLRETASRDDFERVLRSSLEEIQRMSEIVTAVLQVGEQARIEPFHQPVELDLARWVMDNKEGWEKTMARPLFVEMPKAAAMVRVDPKLLYRLVDNLVRNVKHHASAGAHCRIAVDDGAAGVVMRISDDGPGLSQTAVDSLNEEGSTSDAAGVGLNLCYRIAEISGIAMRFANRLEGGLQVEMVFNTAP